MRDFLRQKLQRDLAAKVGILGFIDNTHASAAQLADEVVVGDCFGDGQIHELKGVALAMFSRQTPPMIIASYIASRASLRRGSFAGLDRQRPERKPIGA